MNRREILKNAALFLGYTAVSGTFSTSFLACSTAAKTTTPPTRFLNDKTYNLIVAIADTILPKTSTPSASEVGVPQHIDLVVSKLMDANGQKDFIQNLEVLNQTCVSKNGKSFEQCAENERIAFLTVLDKERNEFAPSIWGITLADNPPKHTFFNDFKGLIIASYFTSKQVGKEILSYDSIPGEYVGCIPYDGQNAWSGN